MAVYFQTAPLNPNLSSGAQTSYHLVTATGSGNFSFTAPAGTTITEVIPYSFGSQATLTMSNISITYTPPSVDLAVSAPQMPGATLNSADGNSQVASGSPVEVDVPVTGSGFSSPETRTTQVQVKIGSNVLPAQTVALADIHAAGTLVVPFFYTFDPSLAGTTQTITATVDPGNVLNEANFSNNVASAQVDVVGKYKLVAYVNGTQVPDAGDTYQTVPSDFIFNTNAGNLTLGGAWPSQPMNVQLGCVDIATGAPVSGCQFQISPLALGSGDGGHEHEDGRPFILGGAESLFDYDGAIHSVDTDGQNLTYRAPIVAGDVNVSIQGFDKSGNPIQAAPPITFEVKIPNLIPLSGDTYTFKCSLAPNASGCPGGGYEHVNFYSVTLAVNADMSKIGSDYSTAVPTDPLLVITDASLAWGGLYDFTNSWNPPHKFHRQGTDIDVRRLTISDQREFKTAVCDHGGYPLPEDSAHYHLFFFAYAGSKSISGLCR